MYTWLYAATNYICMFTTYTPCMYIMFTLVTSKINDWSTSSLVMFITLNRIFYIMQLNTYICTYVHAWMWYFLCTYSSSKQCTIWHKTLTVKNFWLIRVEKFWQVKNWSIAMCSFCHLHCHAYCVHTRCFIIHIYSYVVRKC